MADLQIGNNAGVAATVAVAGFVNINGGGTTGYVDADHNNITSMRARLTAISATLYTAAYLNTMTYNDMVYAIRQNDDPLTIKQ